MRNSKIKAKYVVTNFDPDANLLAEVLEDSNQKTQQTMAEIKNLIEVMKNAHGSKKSQLSLVINEKLNLVKELISNHKKLNEFSKGIQPE